MSVSSSPEGISFIKERATDLMEKTACYVLKNDIVDFLFIKQTPLVFKVKALTTVENDPSE